MLINPKVIIIGAGVAGYSAACRLLENGITNLTVLEAENRIGGRVNSVRFGDANIDLGGQWCHGENVVYNMVKDLDLLQSSFVDYHHYLFVDSNGKFVDSNVSDRLASIAFSIANDKEEMKKLECSFGDYFIERYNEEIRDVKIDEGTAIKILGWIQKFFNSLNASSTWFEVSANGLTKYEEPEGDLTLNWKDNGYSTIFSVLKKAIPDSTEELPVDEKICFDKKVVKINWDIESPNCGNVKVNCSDGSCYDADHVIVTTSLGVLKENYETMFVPDIPTYKKNAIEGLAIGTVNKILLKFAKKWWPDDCIGFSFIWDKEDSNQVLDEFPEGPKKGGESWLESIFGFYPVDNNPYVLMGWVVGPLGPEIELLSDETVLKGCTYLLNRFLGNHYAIAKPDSILRSRWYSNPNFRGSYSYRSLETDRRDTCAADLARPLMRGGSQVVLFAGEATHPCFYSTVHGALESGFREADRIIQLSNVQNDVPE